MTMHQLVPYIAFAAFVFLMCLLFTAAMLDMMEQRTRQEELQRMEWERHHQPDDPAYGFETLLD